MIAMQARVSRGVYAWLAVKRIYLQAAVIAKAIHVVFIINVMTFYRSIRTKGGASFGNIIGTANMDHRSFELNFEVNSMIYDDKTAGHLREAFYNDLKDAVKINPKRWENRPAYKQLPEKVARLMSPLL